MYFFNGFRKSTKDPEKCGRQSIKLRRKYYDQNEFEIDNLSSELKRIWWIAGTPEGAEFDERAYAFYTGQILLDARSEKVTQRELANQGVDKSYFSKKLKTVLLTRAIFLLHHEFFEFENRITRQVG